MEIEYFFFACFLIFVARSTAISKFKIGYYEAKLERRHVDISDIKDIGLIGIFKL